jgi:hypothetical protein
LQNRSLLFQSPCGTVEQPIRLRPRIAPKRLEWQIGGAQLGSGYADFGVRRPMLGLGYGLAPFG